MVTLRVQLEQRSSSTPIEIARVLTSTEQADRARVREQKLLVRTQSSYRNSLNRGTSKVAGTLHRSA